MLPAHRCHLGNEFPSAIQEHHGSVSLGGVAVGKWAMTDGVWCGEGYKRQLRRRCKLHISHESKMVLRLLLSTSQLLIQCPFGKAVMITGTLTLSS